MQVGEYKLQEVLSSHRLFTRYKATHAASHAIVEVRMLTAQIDSVREAAENQWRRLGWGSSPLVQKLLSFQLDGANPHVVLRPVLFQSPQLPPFQLRQFLFEATLAIQAAHDLGLCVGPVSWQLFNLNVDGRCQLDATGLMTHLSIGPEQSWSQFQFAAPETVEAGSFDCVSDVCSWGLFLKMVLESNASANAELPNVFGGVVNQLCLYDAAQRASLQDLLHCFPEYRQVDAATGATQAISPPPEHTMDASGRTMVVDVAPIHQLAVESRLGRFHIERKLGEGGMGAVYQAFDLAGKQLVALKVLSDTMAKNPRALRRFAKEARLLALARSPYVANLVEAHLDGERCYLVSECVEGGSLGDWLKPDQPLPVDLSLALLIDAARGLSLAHDRGIVHRDIKPDNILLTSSGRELLDNWRIHGSVPSALPPATTVLAKLADFGIARTEHQTESLAMTAENALIGTPQYMAPEQCMGSQVDPRADVYSLGITLYRLLAGRVPFHAESSLQLMSMHANDPPPAMRQFAPDVPQAIVQVIDKCLAKNPSARYNHARELLIDLENLLRGQPTAIGLHPPMIDQDVELALTFEHSWELQSPPEKLWPYTSHTDRVNHAMGLKSVDYVTQSDPVMGVSRIANTTVLGQRLQWREHPYEWIEGKRLSVLREFSVGPFEWFVNIVELQGRREGGSTVRQTLRVKPRNWLGKLLAKMQLGNKSRKSFGQVYADIDRYIQAEESATARERVATDPWGVRPQLSNAERTRLTNRLNSLGLSPNTIMLGELIEHGSELEIARIRPYEVADRFDLNRTEFMETCLRAAREGLLILLWDILCPSCRIPSDVVETLSALTSHGHCEACNIEFELDFSRSIEMIFRVHPEIRQAETRTYCVGGPGWSRHVVAQIRLARGERFVCEVELQPGSYTIRGPQLPFSVPFRVSQIGTQSRWEVPLSQAPPDSEPMHLRAGEQTIWLWNDSSRDLQIRIERMAARHDAVTAAAASSSALFRELYGDQVLAGGQLISVAHVTYVLIRLFGTGQLYETHGDAPAFTRIRRLLSTITESVKHEQGAVIKVIGETVVATFPSLDSALKSAHLLCVATAEDELQMGAVVHSGPAVVATLDDRLDYFGKVVHESLALLDLCQPNCILSTAQTLSSIAFNEWCEANGMQISSVPHDKYALLNLSRDPKHQ